MTVLELQAGGLENIGCTEEKNSSFTFTIKENSENKFTHCFWANATSKKEYKFFGDVVIFYTTYNTNKYGLIFAPIVGVNNHWQTVMFGCAFLSGETTDSFVWLFEQFLKAMPASPPKMIIIDQDPTMPNAIAQLFPNALHRYCSWHILNKFSEKLNAISLKGSCTQQHEELISDHVDKNEKPKLKTPLLMEKQIADIYTHTIFLKFQDELCQCFVYVLTKKGEDERNFIYEVKNEGMMEGEEYSEALREHLLSFHANIKTSVGTGGSGGGVLSKINHPQEPIYNDPSQVQAKGCGRRLRGWKEISKNSNVRSRNAMDATKLDSHMTKEIVQMTSPIAGVHCWCFSLSRSPIKIEANGKWKLKSQGLKTCGQSRENSRCAISPDTEKDKF
ncbi:hypothetical protein L1049_010881 [Liquidambar formosana]|uniref:MULE transposase domain-containing protein n=1 Tax=Liquidambar formosana TaxID=63359 RepID=A0AAP0RVV4_LIQFO